MPALDPPEAVRRGVHVITSVPRYSADPAVPFIYELADISRSYHYTGKRYAELDGLSKDHIRARYNCPRSKCCLLWVGDTCNSL